jgi:hypothetical protein
VGSVDKDRHYRKLVGAAALVLSPVFGLIGIAIAPTMDTDSEKWVENITSASTRASIGSVFGVLSLALAVFAVFAIVHMLREREATYGLIGGGIALFGIVLTAVYSGFEAMINEVTKSDVTTGYTAVIMDEATTNPVAIVALVGSVLFAVGLLTLAIGLYRAAVVPTWCAFGFALFAIGMTVGYQAYSSPIVIGSFVVLLAASLQVAWQLFRETDEEWEHTPLVRPIRAQTA